MYKFVIILLILGALLYMARDTISESFESQHKSEHIRLISKLSNMALQPYKGDIETSLTVNFKKGDDYYPQLWTVDGGRFRNMAINKYLTVSSDGTKVVLEPLDDKKKQMWNFDTNGHITNGELAMNVEGANTSDEALVVVATRSDGPAFEWYTEKVLVDINMETILSGELSGKTEKDYKGVPKITGPSYTYLLWFNVNDMNYKNGQWKNIFNHGSRDTGDRNPGLWITPNERKLHIRSRTSNSDNDGIMASKFTFDLDTWYHIAVVVNKKNMKFYVNGQLSEEYNFSGTPNTNGDTYLHLAGGYSGKTANLEYISKAMVSGEILDRMKATSPEKSCKESRAATTAPNNLVRGLEMWRVLGLSKARQNEECPPKSYGGTTITSSLSGKIETSLEMLEKQSYNISIWALTISSSPTTIPPATSCKGWDCNIEGQMCLKGSPGAQKSDFICKNKKWTALTEKPATVMNEKSVAGMSVRPYTNNWSGDWKVINSSDGWKNLTWDLLTTGKANTIGFEISSKDNSRNTLFMPSVSVKVIEVPLSKDIVKVREFRSNGTHVTCSIKEPGLNSLQGWCALNDTRNEYYIEADLDNLYDIKSIQTRGRGDTPQWTTEYRVEYFDPYTSVWKSYGDKMDGNRDMNTVKSNPVKILTDKLRIYPISFHMWPSMRIGFNGTIGTKDKCMDYKSKMESGLEADKKTFKDLYNKECRKVSYYEYEQLEERKKKELADLEAKVKLSELDVNKIKKDKEIIETNNRTMSNKIKLDDECQPIMPKPKLKSKTSPKCSPKTSPKSKSKKSKSSKSKKTGTDHQLLEELVEQIREINAKLSTKEGNLEKINSEISLLHASGVPLGEKDKQKKLEKKKTSTETEIGDLKQKLSTCQANFNISGATSKDLVHRSKPVKEGFESGSSWMPVSFPQAWVSSGSSKSSPSSSDSKVLACSLEQINPYDIRKHKQYQQLISDIKKKATAEAIHKCTPFNEKDIREHKDYPKVLQYVYQIAAEKFGDIKKHQDYSKLVAEVRRRTAEEYGRKTAHGYVKCPSECQMMADMDIRKHPKFKELIDEAVKKTAHQYGEPIPGTSPTLYRKCSAKRDDPNAKKCISHFTTANKLVEGFSSETCNVTTMKDPFNITHHKQFPEMVRKIREKSPDAEKVKGLLEEYKKCQADKQNCSKLVDRLKEHARKHPSDITKHPQIDKYVLKSLAKGEIKRLNCELAKLKHTQTKCVRKFNIENFDGTVEVENPSEAQEIVTKINKLLMDINMKSGVDDKKAFVDIKDATRKAMNLVDKLGKTAGAYVKDVYNDIQAVEKGEKKMSDVAKKHKDIPVDAPVASEIKQMVQCEADLEKNKKAIEVDKKELEECKNDMVDKAGEIAKLTADTECEVPEKAREIRKKLECDTDVAEKKMGTLDEKYEAIKSRILEYSQKNKYLKEELALLRTRCNDRLQRLAAENDNIRNGMNSREEAVKNREGSLAKRQVQLERQEQAIGEMKAREMEKYQYFRDRLHEARSISNRYREQLDSLKATIQNQGDMSNSVRLDMDARIAAVREECNNRVDRYKQMYAEAEKLLDELRTKSMQTPELVEKVNRIENSMAKKVQNAMERTKANVLALTCPREGKQTQDVIDKGFVDDMKNVGSKVDKLEQEVASKVKPEDMMWYNNKFALLHTF
jgi:DNA repair exonuclease SbcCD ATPase subunit